MGSSPSSSPSAAEFWVLSLPSVLVSPDFSTSEEFSPDFSTSEVFSPAFSASSAFSFAAFRLSVAAGLVWSPVMMMSSVPSLLSSTALSFTVIFLLPSESTETTTLP